MKKISMKAKEKQGHNEKPNGGKVKNQGKGKFTLVVDLKKGQSHVPGADTARHLPYLVSSKEMEN